MFDNRDIGVVPIRRPAVLRVADTQVGGAVGRKKLEQFEIRIVVSAEQGAVNIEHGAQIGLQPFAGRPEMEHLVAHGFRHPHCLLARIFQELLGFLPD